ncbi:MAG: carboxypeptidase-like regulatory domain-containing protein, partial [Tannerella sp.]|nr:carboxypeptidase-like regulatory domain-containing protein [Tannerella sp.]
MTIKRRNAKVIDLFEEIEKQTNLTIAYNEANIDLNRKESVDLRDCPALQAVNEILRETKTTSRLQGKKILIVPVANDDKRVTGIVIDAEGEPISGANIVEKGTSKGISTDADGKFTLTVSENATLVISYIGYVSQEITVGSRTNFNITLLEDSKALDEVVVTALGIKRDQKALAYSTQTVKSEAITAVKGAEVATSLTGKISGLKVINTAEFEDDNKPNLLQLRGETALLVIDGMPVYHANMREIAADDIESITVLKGPTASALYGSRGSSGAIMITTKRATKEGLDISVNSNNMFHAGFLVFPQP